ncbi:MAG: RNA polymerase sigma factor [Gemmataceae bacterium]|nr:RNA polymerase sigma factor [Gemmataceae bacterium]
MNSFAASNLFPCPLVSIIREPVTSFSPYADCSDEELLVLIRQGTNEAFGALVRRYEGELYGYLRRYLGDADLADDVFQNTFVQIFTKLHHYQSGRRARPWIYAIATNQAIDALRREKRHEAVQLLLEGDELHDGGLAQIFIAFEAEGPGPLEHIQLEERRHFVRTSVDRLPEIWRGVVILAYYQELKYQDIADILKIPVGTVKSRLHAALGKLQEMWAESPVLREE